MRKIISVIAVLGYLDFVINPNKGFVLLVKDVILIRVIASLIIVSIILLEFVNKKFISINRKRVIYFYILSTSLIINEFFFKYSFTTWIDYFIISVLSILTIFYFAEITAKAKTKFLCFTAIFLVLFGTGILYFCKPKYDEDLFGFYAGFFYELIAKWSLYIALLSLTSLLKRYLNKKNNGIL